MGATIAHRAEYAAFRAAEGALGGLAWERIVKAGRRLGCLWHLVDGAHRRVARDNVARAFPDWSTSRVHEVVRANFEHLGATALEFFGSAGLTAADVVRLTPLEGGEHIEEARARGRGVLFLTAHLGNWEMTGTALAARGLRVHAVGRRLSNPLVDHRVTTLRQHFGVRVISHRGAARPVLKALSKGELVGFLIDQKPLAHEAIPSRFFGRPVATNPGLALLALKSGAPVVPGFCERRGAELAMRALPALDPPSEGSLDERVREFTRRFDAVIEAAVRRTPEQWFWVHRRWRLPGSMAP